MDPRTLGIEEELLLVDPATSTVTSRAREVLSRRGEEGASGSAAPADPADEPPSASRDGRPALDQELYGHMLETRTEPGLDVADVVAQVVAARREAAAAAARSDLGVVVSGSAPHPLGDPRVTPDERYRDMLATFGEVARLGTTCGMHVHVAVESDEEGVAALDRIAAWLPVLLAVSANSPFTEGRDTGYASWRLQQWSSWPSAGPTEAFGSVAGYRRACARLLESGAARDTGMLYFDARLSEAHPTLEVRVLDAVTDPDDVGLLAALVRALVETALASYAAEEVSPEPWRAEELRAARWRASRYGLSDRLLDPRDHGPRPAREVLGLLVDHVRTRLEAAGDLDRVQQGVERVLAGTGATHQRAARERTGSLEGVVSDLLARTEASWAAG